MFTFALRGVIKGNIDKLILIEITKISYTNQAVVKTFFRCAKKSILESI